jgi:tetratricopeptide (TPR) repeat protein
MKIEWIEKYLTKAEELIYNNQVEHGLQILTDLLYDEPGYNRLHNHIGWAYMYYTSDVVKAELHLKMAIKFAEQYAPPYLHLGTLYLRAGRYAEALEYFIQGKTKENANKVAFLESIAQVHEMKQEYSKAIKAYRKAALISIASPEINHLHEGIKRCRKKRLMLYFTF